MSSMNVIKRDGTKEPFNVSIFRSFISELAKGLHATVDVELIVKSIEAGVHDEITTSKIDQLASETCAYMILEHPDYSKLAARLAVYSLHKVTPSKFSDSIETLYRYVDNYGNDASLIAEDVYEFIMANKDALDAAIDFSRDFDYDFFGFKTLERSYLLKVRQRIVERPQSMLLRVACGIHCGDLEATLHTYELLSQRFFTHATPTLFNSGTRRPQMSSCFLLMMKDDSIDGIYDTLSQCAKISKYAGGIGLAVHNIRASGSYIKGTNGISNGLVPMLKIFNETARYVDQGGGKRKGSIAVYCEPWHDDIIDFIQLKKNHGREERRARDLFLGLWIPDLFMERVEEDADWTLMCPNECPGLHLVYGKEFEALYKKYESEGRGRRKVKAQWLWFKILEAQIETGTPYMLYKDACNEKSNQKNIGTIKSSNLCTEILEYTDDKEIAVCNLASVALPKYIINRPQNPDLQSTAANINFDFARLHDVVKTMTRNLNKIIDRNFYPVPETRTSNMRHRPIGIGVQGMADTFQMLRLPYESVAARQLNKHIFETIYHASLEASNELAERDGTYETFEGSPASKGILQFDMWEETRGSGVSIKPDSGLYDWNAMKEKVKKTGLRNSLLVAPMPTASTSQILGNNESFEPYSSNIYMRRVLSGEFIVVNPHLLNDLSERGLWNKDVKDALVASNGSLQYIPFIPDDLKELYKTVWEIKQRAIIDMAADRGAFIDQSQSLNLYVSAPTFAKLSSMHFYGWKKGLKTGAYYLRTQGAAEPIKFTVDVTTQKEIAARKAGNLNTPTTMGSGEMKSAPVENTEDDGDVTDDDTTQQKEIPKALEAQLSRSLERSASKLPPVIEDDGITVTAPAAVDVLEEAKRTACKWRRKGEPIPEGCEMCSG